MANDVAMLLLGAVAVGGVLWFTGALCQQDIMGGALCPPGQAIYDPSTHNPNLHWNSGGRHGAPGDTGRLRQQAIAAGGGGYGDDGYGDDSGYGDDYDYGDYESNAAHISIA